MTANTPTFRLDSLRIKLRVHELLRDNLDAIDRFMQARPAVAGAEDQVNWSALRRHVLAARQVLFADLSAPKI